jgi:hypothetical protein
MAPYTGEDITVRGAPDWQKMQRGWHGVDYMYHDGIDFAGFTDVIVKHS